MPAATPEQPEGGGSLKNVKPDRLALAVKARANRLSNLLLANAPLAAIMAARAALYEVVDELCKKEPPIGER